jgi:hypothetical protein
MNPGTAGEEHGLLAPRALGRTAPLRMAGESDPADFQMDGEQQCKESAILAAVPTLSRKAPRQAGWSPLLLAPE